MTIPLRVLMAEDSEDDALLTLRALRTADYEPVARRVDTHAAFSAALDDGAWDVILSDHSMHQFSSLDALRIVMERGDDIPFLIVSGTISSGVAVEAMRAGARDYILKSDLARLPAAVSRELREARVRREAERGQREAEEKYRTLVERIPAVTYLREVDGTTIRTSYLSPQIESLTGRAASEWIGDVDLWFRALHPEDRARVVADFTHARETGDCFSAEYRIEAADGRIVWLLDEASWLPDESSARRRIQGFLVDITDRKLAEALLLQHADELARSNVELERFAHVASHDLQEPIRTIRSFAQLLQRDYGDKLEGDAAEYLRFITDGVLRMQTLIRDLLAYARIDSQGAPFAPTDCNEILQETLEGLRASIESENVEVAVEALPVVVADGTQLGQLFQNLLTNAIKFRAASSPRIHVSATESSDEWVFAVEDNGIGIEPRYFERIFVIFQRLHTLEEYGGTGIGLAICKRIVARHGGSIWVESQPGRGSTFHFSLHKRGRPVHASGKQ